MCYHCNKEITQFKDEVEKRIPLRTKKGTIYKRRKFHTECLQDFLKKYEDMELRAKEQSDWDKLYQYVRNEVLQFKKDKSLDNHTVSRLKGLRLGKYYPSGNNTIILKRGYDYNTILTTFKLMKPKIQYYLANTNFKDEKHMIDGMMKFVTSEIEDVAKRIESQKIASEKLEKLKIEDEFDYKEKLKQKKSSQKQNDDNDLLSTINEMFGDML